MKQIILLTLIVFLLSAQTTVTPKTLACECSNLLNQADCKSKSGCTWKFTNSILQSSTQQTTQGTCTNETTTAIVQIPTYCKSVINILQCSSTIGCALVNNTCTIFAGCQAYNKTTNAACQAISTQCTSDGIRCITPTACSTYSSQELCTKNMASSGAKSCIWNSNGAGTCEDKKCSDAPRTFKTQSQCNNWIAGCLTNGVGCTQILSSCSQYQQINGCLGMIGSDGPCIANAGSSVCRPIICTDAPQIYSTNAACDAFLKGCLTNGKGCVSSYQSCNTYTQTKGCAGLIGSDGPCISNKARGSNTCRALACTDAPPSANTNSACSKFLSGCITTGFGCTSQLSTCSQYQGTNATCDAYVGIDGKCKGISSKLDYCVARSCFDAPATTNTNSACAAFQSGCVTTGAGCTNSLGFCVVYTGTHLTCAQYIGLDGNCTAPSTQITPNHCVAKSCKDAPTTITTNSGCQAYSYQCVTNGAGCINQQICESTELAISCQGQSDCALNQICLNRSSCSNYFTQSQCQLNQQQYQYEGVEKRIYMRPCIWSASTSTCSNVRCSDQVGTFTTDAACNSALQGCVTNGIGCVDISAHCTSYSGITETCQRFKGLGGIQQCSQLITVTDPTTHCVPITQCSQAIMLNRSPQTSNSTCNSFLKGCFYDGKDNCTSGDCTSYYGTVSFCSAITALNQACWKIVNLNDATKPCEIKQCNFATGLSYLTNAQCDAFMQGCKWNGSQSGGCMTPQSQCSFYQGTLSTCQNFYESNKQCTKTKDLCRPSVCSNKIPPPSATTAVLKGSYCQQFNDNADGYNCQIGQGASTSCVQPLHQSCHFFVAIGSDNTAKVNYCQSLQYPGADACGYINGDYCTQSSCDQFTPIGLNAGLKASFCQNLIIDGTLLCGLASSTATQCSNRSCTDYGLTQATCMYYPQNCAWSSVGNFCYQKMPACTSYVIPSEYRGTAISRAKYCTSLISILDNTRCCYQFYYPLLCAPAEAACTSISIPESIVTDQDKATFCVSQILQDGITSCAYTTNQPTTCYPVGLCTTYSPYQPYNPNSDLMYQKFCQTLKDPSERVCSYIIGTNTCINPLYNCDQYETYGGSIAENQALCSQLTALNYNRKCAYNTPGISKCNDLNCSSVTEQSFETCRSYNSGCTFDGLVCVPVYDSCAQYIAQSIGQGQQANCSALVQIDNARCGWTNGTNCSVRTCLQLYGSLANSQTCQNYLVGCQYDGYSCVAQGPCSNYQPYGTTDARKAEICNKMQDFSYQRCTYIVGGTACSYADPSCQYYLSQPITFEEAIAYCSLAQDQDGQPCGYQIGNQFCSPRNCSQALTASSDADCNNYLKGCEQDPFSSCSLTSCTSAPTTITTNAACGAFRSGCVTNGSGCIEVTASCAAYKGTQATCNGFIGNNIPCTNVSSASATDICINRTCVLNTTARSNAECAVWYPPTNGIANCVWGGSQGCVPLRLCSEFIGTVDSCPTFIASDGPCSGRGSITAPQPCITNNSLCSAAPRTYNTDAQCKSWGQVCMTNGNGCISNGAFTCQSIQNPQACLLYKSTVGAYCDLASQCKTRPSSCDLLMTPFECNNTALTGSDKQTCGWNGDTQLCINLICDLLPVSLTTDSDCSSAISTCTTNGAGCITKGACSTYQKQACGVATTTDFQKACRWQNSVCRPIICTDNATAMSDAECNLFLVGCRTPGIGCLSGITCQHITRPELCLSDSVGSPCLWYKPSVTQTGACINYSKCSDIVQQTHEACQAASTQCTTNGVACISITLCSKTILQVSCIIGTDGQCGWMPAIGLSPASCQLYTNCQAASGATKEQCSSWGTNCILDGANCIERTFCRSYSTQIACISGTDGKCFWDATILGCRLQVCSDSSITTHADCASFQAQTNCTTSGTGCINQAQCSSYKIQAGCVLGTDGVCIWAAQQNAESTTSFCRLKQCTDVQLTQSALCKQEIPGIKCVSNGINCVPQSTCSSYTAREACLGGGSDGVCAFNPGANTTTPNVGTCSSFTQCSHANSDQMACNSRSDACYFNSTTVNGTITSSCTPHTCATKALGTSCQPVPSWDLSSYQICVLSGTICREGNPNELTAQNCYSHSAGTFTWNMNTSMCTACIKKSIENNTDLIGSVESYLVSGCLLILFII